MAYGATETREIAVMGDYPVPPFGRVGGAQPESAGQDSDSRCGICGAKEML